MPDVLTPIQRSRCMAAIRSKHTRPEMIVRRLVHRMGFRFRLHMRALPGSPDIVLPRHRKIIEVRGCFWHGHRCGRGRVPVTRRRYWSAKLERNAVRDRKNLARLRRAGWRVLVVWECQMKRPDVLERRVERFLRGTAGSSLPRGIVTKNKKRL
jgi:DNA mismatch endonuclease (patch repair protein)